MHVISFLLNFHPQLLGHVPESMFSGETEDCQQQFCTYTKLKQFVLYIYIFILFLFLSHTVVRTGTPLWPM